MAYPPPRGPMRPPPRQYDNRGGGVDDPGYQDYGPGPNGYPGGEDGYGSGPRDRYANGPAYGAPGSRPRPSRPGHGPPPGYPPNRSRGGYGGPGRGSRPPPPNGRGPPTGRGGPMNRPPPQRMRQPPPLSPEEAAWENPFSTSQPRRRGSEDRGLANQMSGLDLQDQWAGSLPPDRPHTSNSSRPPRGPPNARPYPGGHGMPPPGYAGPGDRRGAPPGPKRSATTPLAPGQGNFQYPGGYQDSAQDYSDIDSLAPLRPSTAGGSRAQKVTDRANVFSTYASDHELLSHYFDSTENEEGDEFDMPNFDAMPNAQSSHQRGNSIDNHLTPNSEQPNGAYAAYKPGGTGPNEFENFQLDLPQGTSGSGSYETQPYGGPRQGNGPPRPYRGNQPGAYDDLSNGTGMPSAEENPDALPSHPTPFRAGLDQGPKPPPVRQYNNGQASSAPAPQGAAPTRPGDRPQSAPVTPEELQRLQQMVRDKPTDYKTQLILAKKLVEASSVLIGEEGRVDPKTRSKNREKYVMDAYKTVKKLVQAGYAEGMFYMADCYGQGLLGLEADPKEAFTLYQSAAKAGHSESAYRTAVCCELGMEDGGGTKRDALKAVQWYRRAATLGNTPAMYKMGIILLKGLLGQQRNPREALTWLKRAAERADEENPHALHELALLYESTNNNDFIVRDEEYSRDLFTQAADLGYKFSQFRLGAAYEYGLMGCAVDARQSIIWYTRAAAQGEHQSELALSGWYLTGAEGILQQSDTEAYLWARKAAAAGLPKAEYAMGYFTEVGIGVPSNLEDAKRWYWRAASQNFAKARERLEDLKKGGGRMQKTRVSRSAVSKQNEGDCIVM